MNYLKNKMVYNGKSYIYDKTKDSFYFTLYHELGHIKKDYNKLINKIFVIDDEEENDEFALNKMIDSKVLEEINKENIITDKYIKEISNKYKICSSFIVGRLAKLNKIKYNSRLYNDNIEKISF